MRITFICHTNAYLRLNDNEIRTLYEIYNILYRRRRRRRRRSTATMSLIRLITYYLRYNIIHKYVGTQKGI